MNVTVRAKSSTQRAASRGDIALAPFELERLGVLGLCRIVAQLDELREVGVETIAGALERSGTHAVEDGVNEIQFDYFFAGAAGPRVGTLPCDSTSRRAR